MDITIAKPEEFGLPAGSKLLELLRLFNLYVEKADDDPNMFRIIFPKLVLDAILKNHSTNEMFKPFVQYMKDLTPFINKGDKFELIGTFVFLARIGETLGDTNRSLSHSLPFLKYSQLSNRLFKLPKDGNRIRKFVKMVEESGQGGIKSYNDLKKEEKQMFFERLNKFFRDPNTDAETRVNIRDWNILRKQFILPNYVYKFASKSHSSDTFIEFENRKSFSCS